MELLRETPLIGRHREQKALLAPFGGWNMPIQYEGGILSEHRWCREKAALFDVCHMGEFLYRGDIVDGGLEDVFTFSVTSIPEGRSRYGFLLNERGGVIDDLIVFRLAKDEVMIVVNAATADNDFGVIRSRLKENANFSDISAATGKLDPQGPLSQDVMIDLLGRKIASIPYFRFVTMEVLGSKAIVSRTGYTGELGYEIFLPAEKTVELWDKLLKDPRVKPAGLGARDLLRLEVGYSLYGNDLDETITPLEAGLEGFVNFDSEFVGKGALLRQQATGLKRTKVSFRVGSRRSPRHHYEIWSGDRNVGFTTSGGFAPMLGCGIGLGLVSPDAATMETELTIRHENVSMPATFCELPFYLGGSVRK
jgi:aminomethyltransferase